MTNLINRRRMLGAGAGALALSQIPDVFAQDKYPSKNIRVVVPTAQGGSADRLAQVFDDFWGPLLKTQFAYDFYAVG